MTGDREALREEVSRRWLVLDALAAHYYDYRRKGSKPDDPGWHACSCGWQGYWCDWQPHLADVVLAVVQPHLDAERQRGRNEAAARVKALADQHVHGIRIDHWVNVVALDRLAAGLLDPPTEEDR